MQKFLLFIFLCFGVFSGQSQSLKWAVQLDSNNYEATAIVSDDLGNVYSSTTDNTGTNVVSYRTGTVRLLSQNNHGAINWDIQLPGNGRIFDIVVNQNKLYVLGVIKDSLQFGAQWIHTLGSQQYRSFLLCLDTLGTIQWVTPTPWVGNSLLVNLKIHNQKIYTVGVYNDIKSRLDSWDLNGNHLQEKNFDQLRTLSDLEFDSMNNVYLTGTGAPNGAIDTISYTNSNPASSYLTFLIKLNSNWEAQWVHLESFITFDFSPQVEIINDSIYLAYFGISSQGGGPMHIKIKLFATNGQISLTKNIGQSNGFFDFTTTEEFGEKQLLTSSQSHVVKPVYIHFLNTQLIETRTDSIYKANTESMHIAGGNNQYCVAITSYDSLWCNNQFALDLTSPNFIRSNATLCIFAPPVGVQKQDAPRSLKVYPNPATQTIYVSGLPDGVHQLKIYDMQGKAHPVPFSQQGKEVRVDISKLASGLYLLFDEINAVSTSFLVY